MISQDRLDLGRREAGIMRNAVLYSFFREAGETGDGGKDIEE